MTELDDTPKRDRWPNHRAATHKGLMDLELASRNLCPICRLIWHGLAKSERESGDVRSVELEIDPSDRQVPMLYVHFVGSKQQALSTRRLLAMYSGELESSKLHQANIMFFTHSFVYQMNSLLLSKNVPKKKT
jgi:hypothetical protein